MALFRSTPSKRGAGGNEPGKTKSKRHKTFIEAWYKDFLWLEYEESTGMTCTVCKSAKKTNIFTKGCHDLQRSALTNHAASQGHAAALLVKKQAGLLAKGLKKQEESAKDELIPQLRTVHYLVQQNEALSHFPELMMLQKRNGAPISSFYKSHEAYEEMLASLSKTVETTLDHVLKNATFIGILSDESIDIAVFKKMALLLCAVVDGKLQVFFAANITVPDGKADTIRAAIFDHLEGAGIPRWKIFGLGSDGAAVMTGRNNGVGVQLKALYPLIIHIHCCAHRLALAVSQAAGEVRSIKKFELTVKQLFDYVNNAPVRYNRLRELQMVILNHTVTLKAPHAVRWLSVHEAVEALHKTYAAVVASFGQDAANGNPAAVGLSRKIETFRFAAYMCLLLDVMPVFTKLSKVLQLETLDFEKVENMLEVTRGTLNVFLEDISSMEHVNELLSLDTDENGKVVYNDVPLQKIDQEVQWFLDHKNQFIHILLANLDARFPADGMEFVRRLHHVLSPTLIAQSPNIVPHGRIELQEISDAISVVVPLEHFDPVRARADFLMYKQLAKAKAPVSVPEFAMEICTTYRDTYPDFATLFEAYLVVPLNSASCERTFSRQNLVKTKLRNRLADNRMDQLLRVTINGPDPSVFDYADAAANFRTIRDRRGLRLV